MEEKDIIAFNIAYYRKKLGLSQLELAEKLQYSNKNISKWEKGETTPSIFTLKRLSEIFSISVDQLTSQLSDQQNENNNDNEPRLANKNKSSIKVKFVYLLMANAILLIVAFTGIMMWELFKVKTLNKWLLLLYTTPLSCLSVTIFIRCIFKRVDYVSISLIVWLTSLSVFITFRNLAGIKFIFLLACAVQFLIVCIALLVNFHLIGKFKSRFFNRKSIDKQ